MQKDLIEEKYKWDLSLIYSSDDEFRNEIYELKETLEELKFLIENATLDSDDLSHVTIEDFKDYFDLKIEYSIISSRLHFYVSRKSDLDLSNERFKEYQNDLSNIGIEYRKAIYFEDTFLSILGEEKVKEWLSSNSELQVYTKMLKDFFKYELPRILPKDHTALLQKLSKCFNQHDIYSQLIDVDMSFGEYIQDGNTIPITEGIYLNSSYFEDRKLRMEIYQTFYKNLKQYCNTFATIQNGYIRTLGVNAKIYKYENSFSCAMEGNRIPENVYLNLLNSTNQTLPILQFAVERQRISMGIEKEDFHYYDYKFKDKIDTRKFTISEAKEILINSFQVFGDEYIQEVNNIFDERRIDFYEVPNKTSGAYSAGGSNTPTYILMNISDEDLTLGDLLTLAHEIGHSLHSYFSAKTQNWLYSDYSIFIAEIASTLNERLVIDYLKKENLVSQECMIALEIDDIKTTFYRQVFLSELEYFMHDTITQNGILTSEKMVNKYSKLFKKYFGDEIVLDDLIVYEWSRIPHLFYNFYVYQYSTSYALSLMVYNDIKGDKSFVDNYLDLLRSGSIGDPLNLIKDNLGYDLENDSEIFTCIGKRLEELLKNI